MASFARTVSFVAGALAVVGLIFGNLGLVAPLTGFQISIGSALLGGLLAVVLSLVGIVITRGGRNPGARQQAWVGLAIGLGLILAVLAGASMGAARPRSTTSRPTSRIRRPSRRRASSPNTLVAT